MIGKHILAEFYGCNSEDLNNPDLIKSSMIEAANYSKATVLDVTAHKFDPQGYTCLLLLAESHMSIHTYPEYGYAALDSFTCGEEADPQLALDYLISIFKPTSTEIQKVNRGNIPELKKEVNNQ